MVRSAIELKTDVIIVDAAIPILNGLDAGEQVKKALTTVKLIFLTMNPDPELAAECFRRGASAYLVKTCASSELAIAVREVLRGRTHLSKPLAMDKVNYHRRLGEVMPEEKLRLTIRQREVLQLLAEGKVMKQVADILGMKTRTVAFHKYRIMEKLGATTTAELVRYAITRNMVAA
jgi:DNA-binding NarL/FixJ family response regulator